MFDRIIFGFFITLVIYALDNNAHAQSHEVMCRAKAKDVAVQMYQSCVTEARNQKIEQIRKEYQHKLAGLKKYYDTELKKLGNAQNSAQAPKGKAAATQTQALPEKSVVKTQPSIQTQALEEQLPARQNLRSELTSESAKSQEVPLPDIQEQGENLDVINVQER